MAINEQEHDIYTVDGNMDLFTPELMLTLNNNSPKYWEINVISSQVIQVFYDSILNEDSSKYCFMKFHVALIKAKSLEI